MIAAEAVSLLKSFRDRKKPVRLVGLKVSELSREAVAQTSMTSWIEERRDGASA
jgi:hypothetical protein